MLPRKTQLQLIADALAGLAVDVPVSAFHEPYQAIFQAISAAGDSYIARRQALDKALAGRRDRDNLIRAILEMKPGERLEFASLQDIAADLPEIEWLWPFWIPQGMITLLGAVPGAGKSYVALDLARRVIADEAWPDGAPQRCGGANVIYVDAEVVPQLIAHRAKLWRMDMSRLFLMLPQGKLFIDFADQDDRDHLAEMVYHLSPALIVIDSLSSISTRGENNIEDVRDVLSFLNSLAVDAQCGLLLIHHLRKRGQLPLADTLTIDDFRGSGHIIAIARSVIGLSVIQTGPEPDRNGPRRLEIVKTNLARYPEPIGVEFLPLEPEGVYLKYGDAPQKYREPSHLEQCEEWLLEVLADGPMKPKEIVEMAEGEGFSRRNVYRARENLQAQIRNTAGRKSPDNRWELKD